jgi:ubiquinone biosynthesis monooxygenase Coq7
MQNRQLTPLDRFLAGLNDALSTVSIPAGRATRANPAADIEDAELDARSRVHAAGLMRVNHAGEIAAQGLYQGHAAVAREAAVSAQMRQSAEEEFDHLAWCEERLAELDAKPSMLNPLWYGGSFAIGAASGLLGDKWSLGFIKETERQVCEHLSSHLQRLPDEDARSRAIVAQMRREEQEHGDKADAAGAAELPRPVKDLMRLTSKLMTGTAYRL